MDGQSWQLMGVIVIVGAAMIYLVRSAWGTWAGRRSCGSGCGKCAAPEPTTEHSRRIPLN